MRRHIKIMMVIVAAVAVTWISASFSFAHYLWVKKKDGTYAVSRGKNSESIEPYDTACVKQISAKSPDGTGLTVTRINEKDQVIFTTNEKPALVAVTSEWGERVNTTRGKKLINRQAPKHRA